MTTPTSVRRTPALADPVLSRIAWRIAMAAAGRVTVGHLVAVLPDGSRRTFGDPAAGPSAEIHIHDTRALTKLLIDGETGGGEAYMDGLWSSPDLAGLLRWAALNRESLALSAGWFRGPAQLRRTLAHRLRRNTKGQSRRNISAHYDLGNDLLSDVPRRDDDVLERRLRIARPGARRRAAHQVPAHGRRGGPGRGRARARDRDRLGRLRAVCGRRTRLPRDVRDDLAGAAHLGARARRGRRPGGSGRHPAARLPRHHGHVRRDRLDRDARGGRRGVLLDVLRGLRRRPRPGRTAEPPVDHVPGCRLRAAAPRCQLDPDLHLSGRPVPVAGGHRAIHPQHESAHHAGDRHRRRLRADPARVAHAVHGPGGPSFGRWASTIGSSGCGSTTWP